MKYWLVAFLVVYSGIAAADWRKTGSQDQQVEQLVRSLPGAAHVMFELGERYKNLYFAARQEKWEFAEYQVEEIESLVKRLKITRPKRAATATVFLQSVFPELHQAVAKKDWESFHPAFEVMRQQCMACHVSNNHGFIRLPTPSAASSPVLSSK